MEFTLTVRLGNAAFEDAAGLELARILSEVADAVNAVPVADGSPEALADVLRHTRSVFDVNGNRVGGYKISEEA